jgi:predicted enzyme involved in methoxymalonyl-ACP biosynthesis
VRIALLSSYTIDPLVPYLDAECRSSGLVPEFYVAPFNQYMQEILQSSSGLYRFKPEIIFVAVAIEDLYPAVSGYPTTEELEKARVEACERVHAVVDELRYCDTLVAVHELRSCTEASGSSTTAVPKPAVGSNNSIAHWRIF